MGQLIARRLLGADTGRNRRHQSNRRGNNLHRNQFLWQLIRSVRGHSARTGERSNQKRKGDLENFPDLHLLPPEIAIEVLKNLNATDLCLASCVWADLANDEMLWEGLCKTSWGYCTAYQFWKEEGRSFKQLYLLLDEGSLTFNAEPDWGMSYLQQHDVLNNDSKDIALFFHRTNLLCWQKVRLYLKSRSDILEELVMLENYKNQFLPNALRKFFHAVDAPTSRGEYLNFLIDKFANRFCVDNPDVNLTPEIVTILCYSLILLSVDLTSPHVKNKMSKREFIRNICTAVGARNPVNMEQGPPEEDAHQRAVATVDKDFAGHLYDNIYLIGHVAPQRWDEKSA